MQIVFIGTVEFSYYTLKETISNDGNVVGIFTKRSSEFNTDFKDLTPIAKKNNIPIHYINSANSKYTYREIKKLEPDIIFCFGWSEILEMNLLELPPKGVIGVHPAKLPYNRGRHPLIWALFLGLDKSAVTFFKMDKEADTGDIISQKEFNITYSDDARSLYNKIKRVSSSQIKEFLPKLKNDLIDYKNQDKNVGNTWRKRGKIDGKIDWRMSSRAIYNLVRALTKPYIGAHCLFNNNEIKVWKVREVKYNNKNIEPGKVIKVNNNSFVVKTYDGAIEITDHEFNALPKKGDYLKW